MKFFTTRGLSDSDFPPKMDSILQPHEPPLEVSYFLPKLIATDPYRSWYKTFVWFPIHFWKNSNVGKGESYSIVVLMVNGILKILSPSHVNVPLSLYLKRHIKRVHLKIKEHHCDLCSNSYSFKNDLKNHVERTHLKINRYNSLFLPRCLDIRRFLQSCRLTNLHDKKRICS